MEVIADILLAAGALGAALYCFVLSRRLKRFNDLKKGVGGAVAVLSAQVDDLTKTVDAARVAASTSGDRLNDLTQKSEAVAHRLELLVASLHDVEPEQQDRDAGADPETPEPDEGADVPAPASGLMFMRHGREANEARK